MSNNQTKNVELLQLFDINNKPVDKFVERTNKLNIPENLFLKVAMIWIENDEGKFLIQKTSPQKKSKFSTTGGHTKFGADGLQTILEETEEELGVKLNKDNVKHLGTENNGIRFEEIFYIKENLDIQKLKLQKEEVEAVQWLTISQIEEKIANDEFIKSHARIFEKYILHKDIEMPKFQREQ